MTTSQAQKQAEEQLKAAGITSNHLDAQILLELVTGQDRAKMLAHPEFELSGVQIKQYKDLIKQRTNRIPLVHLTGIREFYGMDFIITPDVLTPRVETEKMAEWAIKYAPKQSKLIDIGTGCGAIALSVAKHRPDLEVWATDVSEEALKVAKRNADKHKLNTKFIQSHILNSVKSTVKFSTIVTNLPYLKNDADLMPEVQKEPSVALFGGTDGLDLYRKLFRQLPDHLESGGYLFTECDPWQQPDLIEMAQKTNLQLIEQSYFILGFENSGEKPI